MHPIIQLLQHVFGGGQSQQQPVSHWPAGFPGDSRFIQGTPMQGHPGKYNISPGSTNYQELQGERAAPNQHPTIMPNGGQLYRSQNGQGFTAFQPTPNPLATDVLNGIGGNNAILQSMGVHPAAMGLIHPMALAQLNALTHPVSTMAPIARIKLGGGALLPAPPVGRQAGPILRNAGGFGG